MDCGAAPPALVWVLRPWARPDYRISAGIDTEITSWRLQP